ncbi:MAG: peptidoglycan DD-metalloendopeptidase family protein [Bacteroidota bacterium]
MIQYFRPDTLILVAIFFGALSCTSPDSSVDEKSPIEEVSAKQQSAESSPQLDEFGVNLDRYEVVEEKIGRGESLYVLLNRHDVSPLQIDRIQREASNEANLRHMRAGQTYRIYLEDGVPKGFVWQMNRLEYLRLQWDESSVVVDLGEFETRTVRTYASGTIDQSLYLTLQEQGVPQALASEIADIYAWEINFFALRQGDSFKAIYDEVYVGDERYGIGRVHSAEFVHRGQVHKAYHFDSEDQEGYYNERGESLERDLLMAPFRYNQRVSSSFSQNRMHPILNRRRPHHGVDYAAPQGTPIIAVGDGTVREAQYRGGNGNIVQIEHNSVYKTAYLHMSRFADGVRAGSRVRQGQVIGYVGSTGLATGPHVCYRLYKNGEPINSRTADLPVSESLAEQYHEEFQQLRIELDYLLAAIDRPEHREELFSSVISGDQDQYRADL